MSINSRQKGAGAEREFAGLVRDWTGVRLARNLEQSRSGGHDLIVHPEESGIVAEAFRRLAIECKRYQSASDALIQKWWAQAVEQAVEEALIPVLTYRANRSPWRVVVPIWLINAGFGDSVEIEYTATLSVQAFCQAVSEGASAITHKESPA
ncbi:putative PDDEXK endonuclease [Methylomonas rhizoryzae]|uniref:putative PDDEXK endonuclease n=1 Tax=Methylomonas rhizoryzae TaxID=2608981 RepID=UPI001231F01A|nr:hypothetical protein [Methylomonas rhizoryzae]